MEQVKQITYEILGIPVGELKPSDDFIEDLGADSLAMFELRLAFENRFRIVIPDHDVSHLSTIEEATLYLTKRLENNFAVNAVR